MRHFAKLIQQFESEKDVVSNVYALAVYLDSVNDNDKMWTIALLSDLKPSRTVSNKQLVEWVIEFVELPHWLYEESYNVVGDHSETAALFVHDFHNAGTADITLSDCMKRIAQLKNEEESVKQQEITSMWSTLGEQERVVFNKLLTGGLRAGAQQEVMVKALARHTGLNANNISIRLSRAHNPLYETFEDLVLTEHPEEGFANPYTLSWLSDLDVSMKELGDANLWQIEPKWDGVRAQLIVRGGKHYVWSHKQELITKKFPEFETFGERLPSGTVVDGEIMVWKQGAPLPLEALHRRMARKTISKKLMLDVHVCMILYDILEWRGEDIRSKPLVERRALLQAIPMQSELNEKLIVAPLLNSESWSEIITERVNARKQKWNGIMLRRKDSEYQHDQIRGVSWRWKPEPLSVKAVLLYAQRGEGQQASVFVDFTFAVQTSEGLVSFTKAYEGLAEEQYEEIGDWVRNNTIERFGPVLSVRTAHVFELHFEDIALSARRKSGVIVQKPRIHQWLREANPGDADTIEYLRSLIF